MTFFITPLFELSIYFFFFTTAYLAYKKHGIAVLLLFGLIVAIALSIEIPAIGSHHYAYLGFLVYLFNYPISLPLGWCVFFYWAHTFSESIVEWDGTLIRALTLAVLTGVLTGSMSLFLEPVGQALGWWQYYVPGASGIMWFGVPIEINLTYFLWGCFDATVFRLTMYKHWLKREDVHPAFFQHYPAFCSIIFFTAMFLAVFTINNQSDASLFLLFPNVVMWAVIYVFRFKEQYPLSFQKGSMTKALAD